MPAMSWGSLSWPILPWQAAGYRDAVGLLQDIVQHPRFDESAVHTERAIALTQLAQLRDDMVRYPVRLATDAAFAGHPYGRALLGTEESLQAVTAAGVREKSARSSLDGRAKSLAPPADSLSPLRGASPAQIANWLRFPSPRDNLSLDRDSPLTLPLPIQQ